MRIPNADFLAEVKELYIQDPCRLSSIAFWKLQRICLASDTYRVESGEHTYLYALRNHRLEFYWSDDPENFLLPPTETDALDFVVLHQDFYALISERLADYQVSTSCPMAYNFDFPGAIEAQATDQFAGFDFDLDDDFELAADVLNRCYGTGRHTAGEVAAWRQFPVFDPDLWIWVREPQGGRKVGLGISTYQASIRESYLDWVQILPEHQGRGLGRLLVAETVRRARPRSDIIRVTGIADDFYRKCGFGGQEIWRIASRRPGL